MLETNQKKSSRFKFLLPIGILTLLLAVGGILKVWLVPIDGKYSGEVLDALSTDSRLLMKQGNAFISRPDGKSVLYGHYSKTETGWKLTEIGHSNVWKIERNLTGLVLISPTNSEIRYRFIKGI
jgi:hypothetical protein